MKVGERGYTYHSEAYRNAWSESTLLIPLWCPLAIEASIDYDSHLFDHFPLIFNFHKYGWNAHMVGCFNKHPS